jgi:AraC-like DNA-binding protein
MMLGYTDLSSFSRAYKRWTGVGPQQAREAEKTA